MRFQKSHMQIHEAYQFLHKKRTAQVTRTRRQKPSTSVYFSVTMLINPAVLLGFCLHDYKLGFCVIKCAGKAEGREGALFTVVPFPSCSFTAFGRAAAKGGGGGGGEKVAIETRRRRGE